MRLHISVLFLFVALGCSGPEPNPPEVDAGELPPGPAPTVCTSGVRWRTSEGNSAQMAPGQACRHCHLLLAPDRAWFFMGTVFPSLHEEDDCAAPPPPDTLPISDD